jgi:hypothetical protein
LLSARDDDTIMWFRAGAGVEAASSTCSETARGPLSAAAVTVGRAAERLSVGLLLGSSALTGIALGIMAALSR